MTSYLADRLDQRIDASGKPWKPRNLPLLALSRTRAQGFIVAVPVWSYTLLLMTFSGWAFITIAGELFHELSSKRSSGSLTYAFMFSCMMLAVLAYRSVRIRSALHDRAIAEQCLCCAHDLAATPDEHPGLRRCPECGHIWAWPPPPVGPLML